MDQKQNYNLFCNQNMNLVIVKHGRSIKACTGDIMRGKGETSETHFCD